MYRPVQNERLCTCHVKCAASEDIFYQECERKAEAQCDLITQCALLREPDPQVCTKVTSPRKKRDLNNGIQDDYIKSLTRKQFPYLQVNQRQNVSFRISTLMHNFNMTFQASFILKIQCHCLMFYLCI